jgi:ribulose-bisphosphate carboxylase large chain
VSVITAVYEVAGDDPQARATGLAVEQSHELPTELAPPVAMRSLGRVVELRRRDDGPALATVEYPVELAGDELSQLLVLLIGNVSLQDGIRLVDLDVPEMLAAAVAPPSGPGVAGIRRLAAAPTRPLLATALKPVGLDAAALAEMAYELAAGGVDIIKDDQGLADQVWAPFAERVERVVDAVARANADHGTRAIYLPAVTRLPERAELAVRLGADGALVLPGISGFDAFARARAAMGDERVLYGHPSFLGGFTASVGHGIAPHVLFGLVHRLAGADAVIFPSYGGRFSLTEQQCRDIADAARRPFAGLPPVLPSPGGGMSIGRVPELVDLYGRDVLLLIGADLHRGGDLRASAARFREAAEAV